MDQAAHHEQQLQVQHDIEDALRHARALGLTENEVNLLAWASGVQLKQENRNEMAG